MHLHLVCQYFFLKLKFKLSIYIFYLFKVADTCRSVISADLTLKMAILRDYFVEVALLTLKII